MKINHLNKPNTISRLTTSRFSVLPLPPGTFISQIQSLLFILSQPHSFLSSFFFMSSAAHVCTTAHDDPHKACYKIICSPLFKIIIIIDETHNKGLLLLKSTGANSHCIATIYSSCFLSKGGSVGVA